MKIKQSIPKNLCPLCGYFRVINREDKKEERPPICEECFQIRILFKPQEFMRWKGRGYSVHEVMERIEQLREN